MNTSGRWGSILIVLGLVLLMTAGGVWAYPRLSSLTRGTTPSSSATPSPTLIVPRMVAADETTPTQTRTHAIDTPSLTATATTTPELTRDTPVSSPVATETVATGTMTQPPTPVSPTPSLTWTPVMASPTTTVTATETLAATVLNTPLPPRITIPDIGVNAAIVEVTWQVVETNEGAFAMYDTPPAHQVGHHQNSVQPGQPGNCVLSGHGRDDASFGRLVELTPAAEILVTNAEGETFTYTVTQVERLLEVGATIEERLSNARYLEDTEATRLTLVTCWPSWAYTHRIVVIAEPAG